MSAIITALIKHDSDDKNLDTTKTTGTDFFVYLSVSKMLVSCLLTLFQLLVFLRSVQMVTNQKVLSNRASDKSRVSRVGSIVIAVSRAFQKGGGRLLSEQGLAPYTRL